jgi:hypothetical protein
MLGKPALQPMHTGRRKFGNRIIGATGLGAHDCDGIARPTRGGLFTLQHDDGPTSAGELASDARTSDAGTNDDDG